MRTCAYITYAYTYVCILLYVLWICIEIFDMNYRTKERDRKHHRLTPVRLMPPVCILIPIVRTKNNQKYGKNKYKIIPTNVMNTVRRKLRHILIFNWRLCSPMKNERRSKNLFDQSNSTTCAIRERILHFEIGTLMNCYCNTIV